MKTVFLYVDGMRYDYVQHMPFLKKLSKSSITSSISLEPLHQFEFPIFTSQHQNNQNLWAWFYLNEKDSPFKWTKYFPVKYLNRELITYASALLAYLKGETRFVKIANIPLDKAPLFSAMATRSFVDANPAPNPTLFDVLRKNKVRYLAYEWPLKTTNHLTMLNPLYRSDKAITNYVIRNIKKKDFVFAHTVKLDNMMHHEGVNSEKVIAHLKTIDQDIERLYNEIKKYNYTLIICSDHGMVPITKTLDVMQHINKEDIAFPDSTSVRIWTKNPKELAKKLSTLPGKVYTKETMKQIPLKYDRPYTSDVLFIANAGIQILPNYFDGNNRVKAMHGYHDKTKDLHAFFLIKSTNKLKKVKKEMTLVDICPTILEAMNIKQPKVWKGKKLIKF